MWEGTAMLIAKEFWSVAEAVLDKAGQGKCLYNYYYSK